MTNGLQQARIEAAAEGMWNLYGDLGMFTHAPEHLRNRFMKDARAALAAADAHLPTVEQIAEVLDALPDEMVEIESRLVRQSPTNLERARAVLALLNGENDD